MSAETFIAAREALIERLAETVRVDERLAAFWLQGSLADGSDDPWSDVDAFVAVRDGHFDTVFAERWELLERIVPVITRNEVPALRMLNGVVAGPVKLDLLFEPVGEIGGRARQAVRVVVDKDGVTGGLRAGWKPPLERAAEMIDTMFRGTFQGALWPVRLVERGQWVMLVGTELQLVNDYLAAMMAVQIDPVLLFKNPFSRPRHLPAERQAELEALGMAAIAAGAARDVRALRDAHLAIVETYFREGRAAYTAVGLDYPMSAEAEEALRTIYRELWPEQAGQMEAGSGQSPVSTGR